MKKPLFHYFGWLVLGALALAFPEDTHAGPNVGGLNDIKQFNGASILSDNWSDPFNWTNLDPPVEGNQASSFNNSFFGLSSERHIEYDVPAGRCYVILTFGGAHRITGGKPLAFNIAVRAENAQSFRTVLEEGGVTAAISGGGAGGGGTDFFVEDGAELEMNGLDLRADSVMSCGGTNPGLAGRGPARLLINGPITSPNDARLFLRGTKPGGSFEFTRANSFAGEVRVEADAFLRVTHKDALGATTGLTRVTNGTLEFALSQAVTVAEPIRLEAGRIRLFPVGALVPTLTFSGEFDCGSAFNASGPRILDLGQSVAFTGAVTGSITANGRTRTLTFGGTATNAFFELETDADVTLAKPNGVEAVRSLDVDAGATVVWNADEQIGDPATGGGLLTLSGGAVAELGGHRETMELILGRSTVRLGSGSVLRVTRFRGGTDSLIEGAGAVEISGSRFFSAGGRCVIQSRVIPAGTNPRLFVLGGSQPSNRLILDGVCTVPLVLRPGIVEVNSTSPAADIFFENEFSRSGTLLGSGTVGTIGAEQIANGLLSPGRFNEPGILRSGNVTLKSNLTFRAELRGTTPGSGHDQLAVTGTVDLAGAMLVVDFAGFTPVAGTSFTILSNDGTDPVIGTFAGMPQGATVLGGRFVISYIGGSGNDVVLTAVAPPTGVTRTWTGDGSNDFWSTAQNWSPAGAPQNGDALVFPSNTPRRTNINDRSNLAVQSLTLSGGPFTLAGNPIALAGGLTVTGTILINHSVQFPISLTAPQTFAVGPQSVTLTREIETNGMALTFRCDGTPGISAMTCNGVISSGAGDQFVKSGNGLLRLGGASTTRGNFHIERGVVRLTDSAALGSRVGTTTVDAGAELVLAGTDLAFNEPVELMGKLTIADDAGTVAISDPIYCAATAEIFVSATGVTQVNMFDELVGIALKKSGPGAMNITGAKTKSLEEGITIDAGRLVVTGTSGVIALPGNTTVRGILEIRQRNVTEPDSQVIIGEGGTLVCDSPEIAFAGVTMTGGTLTTDGNGMSLNGPVTILPSATTSLISGNVTLPGGINDWSIADGPAVEDLRVTAQLREAVLTDAEVRLNGAGTSVFTANNSIDQFTLLDGNATFQGTSTNTALRISGGTARAAGRFLDVVVAGGILAPGAGLGQCTVLEVDGTGGRFDFEINGAASDRIVVTGPGDACDLSSSPLALLQSAAPAIGTVLTLVDVQGSGQIRPFRGHPEATTLFAGTQRYRISYAGGDGNNVTLTALAPAPPPDLRFTSLSVTENLAKGFRSLHVTVSGGEGAIGLGIPFETSANLAAWEPLPFLLFGDPAGNISFEFKAPLDDEGFFIRAAAP